MIKPEELGKRYYNLRNHHFSHWSTDPDRSLTVTEKVKKSWTQEKRQMVSDRMKGNTNGRGKLGKPGTSPSEETREKLSKALKQSYIDGKKIRRFGNSGSKGRLHSEEVRQKISEAGKGRVQSKETRLKRSVAMKATLQTKHNAKYATL